MVMMAWLKLSGLVRWWRRGLQICHAPKSVSSACSTGLEKSSWGSSKQSSSSVTRWKYTGKGGGEIGRGKEGKGGQRRGEGREVEGRCIRRKEKWKERGKEGEREKGKEGEIILLVRSSVY